MCCSQSLIILIFYKRAQCLILFVHVQVFEMGNAQCVFEDWQDVIGISYFAIEIVSVNLLTKL